MDTAELMTARFWESRESYVALHPSAPDAAEGLADFANRELGAEGWCFFQTSGSESRPKWVGLTRDSFLISARSVNAMFEFSAGDRWALALPLHHVGGFSILARAFLVGSAVDVQGGKWNPEEFLAACFQGRSTITSLVPTQVFDLVAAKLQPPSWMRVVFVGGGRLSPELARQALDLGWPVHQTYGMTEAASQVATQRHPSDEMLEVLPCWQVSTDSEGRLVLRGPGLARGYAARMDDGSWEWQKIDHDAGLATRDYVEVMAGDGRQWLRFLGREASFVKVKGELVHLDALTESLAARALELGLQPDFAVAAEPDERRETRLMLALRVGSVSEAEVENWLIRHHAVCLAHERIQQSVMVPQIPRSELGKLRREELSRMLKML